MRLNRTTAQFRDRDRQGLVGQGSVEDEACMQIWRELVGEWLSSVLYPSPLTRPSRTIANWRRRTDIVEYCVGVVDRSMDSKRTAMEAETEDPAAQRRIQGALYAEEVKVRIHMLLTSSVV